MQITSSADYMTAHLPNDIGVVWHKGSHYANIYEGWNSTNPIDCFSFAWEKNLTSQLDFTSALQSHIEYMEAS